MTLSINKKQVDSNGQKCRTVVVHLKLLLTEYCLHAAVLIINIKGTF